MARLVEPPSKLGLRLHTKESKRWCSCLSIQLSGFDVDANLKQVEFTECTWKKGREARGFIVNQEPTVRLSARVVLRTVSFLNFYHWFAPTGFCRLSDRWSLANNSGVMKK